MVRIAFDSHKRYTLCSVEDESGNIIDERRLEHQKGVIANYLSRFDPGTPVAVETIGSWYHIVDEIEAVRLRPVLVHAYRAKKMIGQTNKTDRLDVRGLNRLQRTGTLPTVWIPPAELRDKRDLYRTRMGLVRQRTWMKNRIHATLDRYGIRIEASDLFGRKGMRELLRAKEELPPNTRFSVELQLEHLAATQERIRSFELKMREVFSASEDLGRLRTIPGIGPILGVTVLAEIGDISRFPGPESLASYSGTAPRVHSSGGKTFHGPLRNDVNHYLKWAFIEAANIVALCRRRYPKRHASLLYERIRSKKNHAKAVGAVARHLAEAAYWVLKRKENYRDPAKRPVVSDKDRSAAVS